MNLAAPDRSPSLASANPAPASRGITLLIAGTFVLLRIAQLMLSGWSTADEAWVLQVAQRCNQGEALYRDVFFNCTPVSIYLARAVLLLAAGTGAGALTLKAMCALFETGIFLCTRELLHALIAAPLPRDNPGPMTPRSSFLLAAIMFVVPGPVAAHFYNDLATLLALMAAVQVTRWQHTPRLRTAAIAGVILGLAVMEKQNIGAYIALASAGMMLLARPHEFKQRLAHTTAMAGVALALAALLLLPTILADAAHAMLTDTLGMKGQYLQAAGVDPLRGFAEVAVPPVPWDFGAMTWFAGSLVYPLALLAASACVWGLCRRSARQELLRIAPLCAVLIAGVYPRADAFHVCNAMPAIVLVLVIAGGHLEAPARRLWLRSAALAAASIALVTLFAAEERLRSPDYVFSALPHLRGIVLPRYQEQDLATRAAALAKLPQPVFILSADAGGLYLVSGLRNSTPYDYVISSELPPGTQEQLIQQIREGRIQTVVLEPRRLWYTPAFIPEKLQTMVETDCMPDGRVGDWDARQWPGPLP